MRNRRSLTKWMIRLSPFLLPASISGVPTSVLNASAVSPLKWRIFAPESPPKHFHSAIILFPLAFKSVIAAYLFDLISFLRQLANAREHGRVPIKQAWWIKTFNVRWDMFSNILLVVSLRYRYTANVYPFNWQFTMPTPSLDREFIASPCMDIHRNKRISKWILIKACTVEYMSIKHGHLFVDIHFPRTSIVEWISLLEYQCGYPHFYGGMKTDIQNSWISIWIPGNLWKSIYGYAMDSRNRDIILCFESRWTIKVVFSPQTRYLLSAHSKFILTFWMSKPIACPVKPVAI